MKKKFAVFPVLFVLFSMTFCCYTVHAAQKNNITLKPNTTYTKYDVTSDGRADNVYISDGHAGSDFYISIYVNGRNIWNKYAGEFARPEIKLYTLKNGRNYLQVKCIGANDHVEFDYLITYKKGAFTTSANLKSHVRGAWLARYNSKVKKIGTNSISFTMQTQPGGIGMIEYPVTYKQSGYLLKPTSSIYPLSYNFLHPYRGKINRWFAVKRFAGYSKAIGGKKIFTTNLYEQCMVNKIYFSNKYTYINVTVLRNGKKTSGWVKCPNTYKNPFFQETLFI